MFWHFLVFQYEEPSCRKHDRNTEQAWLVGSRGSGRPPYQQEPMPHDRRKASAKAANMWHAVAWSCAPRAHLRLHVTCKMSGGLLCTFGIHFRTSWTPRVVWMAHRGVAKYFNMFGPSCYFFGVLCLRDARLWGKVAGGSICWVPACLITSQTLLRDKFPNIVSKFSKIVSKVEKFSFQDVWYRFQDGFWPTDKEATGHSKVYLIPRFLKTSFLEVLYLRPAWQLDFSSCHGSNNSVFPQTLCPPWGVLRWAGVRFSDQGTLSGARFFAGCKFNFSHKSSLVRCPRAFRLRSLTQSVRLSFVSFERIVLLARRARFLSCVHFVWQAWDIRDILGSKTSFGVTGAGHRTLFHPRGTRDTCARC